MDMVTSYVVIEYIPEYVSFDTPQLRHSKHVHM